MCDWCQLVKPACTHSLCRHVIGVVCSSVWCLCVCKNVHIHVCVAHTENTPDASHHTTSSCRDWLLARHGKMDWRKLMSGQTMCRPIFCRCCALATLDDTLHRSSVVGYMCKTIQWLVLTQVETPAYGPALCEESSTTVMSEISLSQDNKNTTGRPSCMSYSK